jgi:hypothetical protein
VYLVDMGDMHCKGGCWGEASSVEPLLVLTFCLCENDRAVASLPIPSLHMKCPSVSYASIDLEVGKISHTS